MLPEGIFIGSDGLLDITDERLKNLLVQDDINEIYEVEQTPFARGKFAAVRRAIHKKSGVHFAAKFLKRRRRAQSSDKEIKHEIAVLLLCSDSDNIVQLNAVHESRSDTALLLELATGGELQALLDNDGSLTEAQARYCMREVLKALQFLHKRSIAHLDLKPQNILLSGDNVEDGLKLCDFGISRVIESGSKVREILGTPDYVAPEVLQYEPLCLQTDIWSVGVLTYVLLSGYSPFGGDTKQETFLNISQCALTFPEDLFKDVSDQAIDFIKRTLRIKPNDRLTALECLEHFWLKDEFSIDKRFCNASMASDGVSSDPYEIIDDEDDVDEDDEREGGDSDDQIANMIINNKQSTNSKLNGCLPKENSFNGSIELKNDENHHHAHNISQQHHQNHHFHDTTNNGRLNSSLSTRKSCTNNANDSTINIQNNQKSTGNVANGVTTSYDEKSKLIVEVENSENKENFLLNSSHLVLHLNATNRLSNTSLTRDNSSSLQLNSLTNGYETNSGYDHHYHHNIQNEKLKSPQLINQNSPIPTSSTTMTTTTTNSQIQNGTSLFPDAPTTPKVIRKAPSESPTSVKALVKKFQLESGEPLQSPTLLKESVVLVSDYHECGLNGTSGTITTTTDIKYINGCNSISNGSSSCSSSSGSSTSSNSSSYINISSNDILIKEQNCNSSTKLLNGNNSLTTTNGTLNQNNCITNSPIKSLRATVASVAAAASCSVFCLTKCNACGNTSTGCRHSNNTTQTTTTTATQVINHCSNSNTNTNGKSSSSICLDHSIIC